MSGGRPFWPPASFDLPRTLNLGFVSERAASRHGNARVVLGEPLDVMPGRGVELDHAALDEIIASLGDWLYAQGVRPGDSIAVLKRNNFDIVLLACALARIGAVPALLSAGNDPVVTPQLLDRLEPALVILDRSCEEDQFRYVSRGHRRLVLPPEGIEEAVIGATAAPLAPRATDEIAIVTQTSGTTGTPKLVAHSGRSLLGHGRMQVPLGRLILRRRHLLAACLPWVHVRSVAAYVAIAYLGNPALAISSPDAEHLRELLATHRPEYLEAHPDAFLQWEHLAEHRSRPFASVRLYFSTFDAAHPRTIRTLLDASARRWPLYAQIYAQSETSGVTFRLHTRRSIRRDRDGRNVGRRVWPFTKVRVVDPQTGRRLAPGKVGAIQAKSVGRCVTYVGQEELAASKRHGAWWDMTDIGSMSRGGALRVLDREVDRIPGVDSVIAIEDALLDRLPGCTEAVLLPDLASRPVAVLSFGPSQQLDRIAWGRLAAELRLRDEPIVLERDQIPRTATGKVKRAVLRERVLGVA